MYICIENIKIGPWNSCNPQAARITSRPLYGGGSGVCVYFAYVYIVL